MSTLNTYNCTNESCPLEVQLSKDDRVWLTDMTNPHHGDKRIYKAGLYVSDEACIACKTISSITTDTRLPKQVPECPNCHTQNSFLTAGADCHKCHQGKIYISLPIHFFSGGHSDEDEVRYEKEKEVVEVQKEEHKEQSIFTKIRQWFTKAPKPKREKWCVICGDDEEDDFIPLDENKTTSTCLCTEPQCGKCLGINCTDTNCPTHTDEAKKRWRERRERNTK